MSMGGAITEENNNPSKRERIIPIRILKSPHVIEEEDEEESLAPKEGGEQEHQSKRHSLSVELDDGTLTETLGTSMPLGSSTMIDEELLTSTSSTSRTERIFIEEIGLDTLKREIRGNSPEKKSSTAPNSVRLVPISLPDGKIIETLSEETLSNISEFTSTTHEDFPSASSSKVDEDPSMSVPINVSNKEESDKKESSSSFFSEFDEFKDLPDWKNFPPPSEVLPGNGDEKFIPIILEKSQERRHSSTNTTSTNTKRHSKEILVTEEPLDKTTNKTDKKTELGRPTVRFNVDSETTAQRKKKEDTADEIHKIDEDINKIWNELRELDSEPRPGSSVSSWPKTTNPPPRYPKSSPVTPHKVSILESPKYTPIRDSSLTRSGVIKSSSPPGSSLKSVKTNNLSNPFGPIEEGSSPLPPPKVVSAPSSDSLPRKGSTASMTVVTSSYKPTPSFAQPLTIKGGQVKTKEIEDSHEERSPASEKILIPPSSSSSTHKKDTLDKETQTSIDMGKKENCSLM